jgi:hypothetical protein
MKKLTLPLTLVAAATLAACASPQYQTANSEPIVYVTATNSNVRAGPGKITELLDPTGPINGISWQRMTLKMADGSFQVVDRRGHQVAMGEAVWVR